MYKYWGTESSPLNPGPLMEMQVGDTALTPVGLPCSIPASSFSSTAGNSCSPCSWPCSVAHAHPSHHLASVAVRPSTVLAPLRCSHTDILKNDCSREAIG